MSQILFPQQHYPEDVVVLQQEDKTILLVGTAHISQQSTDLVKQVIEQERPDVVCIELDEKRFTALSKPQAWENLDLKQVIKSKQLTTLLVNLILSTYQKKLGGQLGIMPGTELLTAAQCAEHRGIPIALCDRDVRITLRRAWRATSLWKKGYLLATLIASLFDRTELTEEKLQEMRSKDVLSELIKEMADALPQTKAVLIDERDIYMAEKIKETKGSRVVAVVGAGHMEGIRQVLSQDNQHRMEEIANLPPASSMGKIIGWGIPALILLTLFGIGLRHGMEEFGANALYWILANAVPTAVGAAVALGHPLTVLAGFAGSPLTSLTPLVGAGYVCAFVQVMAKPPVVKEFEQVSNAITTVKGWWQNKLLRIFLVFMLTTLGSAVGTWVGGYKLVSSLAQ